MNIARYMTEESIRLQMETVVEPCDEDNSVQRWRQACKECVLNELVTVLENGHRVGNRSKLLIDFINREKQATTSLGHGVAVPHIRSMQAKEFTIGFARSREGYDFDAPDDQPVHLFFVMAAPPYEDSLYLKVFKSLSEILQYESVREELMTVKSAGEVLRIMRSQQ